LESGFAVIRTILVDDEKPALAKLENLLEQYPRYSVVGAFTDPYEALNQVPALQPMVAFLDISMPGIDGIELANRLKKATSGQIKVVFITAYDTYAVHAFDVQAVDYLMKPVGRTRFKQTIDLLDRLFQSPLSDSSQESITVQTGESQPLIRLFGKLEIVKDGETLSNWRTAKIRELFALYLHNRESGIYRDEILHTLWEGISMDKALSSLNTCNYYLRTFLNKSNSGITLEYSESYYKISLKTAICDTDLFLQAEKQAEQLSELNILSVLEGAALYRGRYLEDVKSTWVNLEREKYASLYSSLRSHIARYYHSCENFDEAIRQAILGLNNNWLNKEAWLILINSYYAKGDAAAYKRSIREMKDVYREKAGMDVPAELDHFPD
jgi:two-component SAPR family response regulator